MTAARTAAAALLTAALLWAVVGWAVALGVAIAGHDTAGGVLWVAWAADLLLLLALVGDS